MIAVLYFYFLSKLKRAALFVTIAATIGKTTLQAENGVVFHAKMAAPRVCVSVLLSVERALHVQNHKLIL